MLRRTLVVAALAALIAGCATPATVFELDELEPENGLVIMRLSSNSLSTGFFKYWNTLSVREVGVEQPGEFQISLSRKGNARSAVYFGSLPPGRYRLEKLHSEQCGAMCISSTITINEKFGDFDVAAGRTTDLGHVVYSTQGARKVAMTRGDTMTPWIPAYIANYYPNIQASAVAPPYLGWVDEPARGEALQAMYERDRTRSLGLLKPSSMDDGSILFGTLLGMVKRWEPGKVMVVYDTGMQGAVESVVEVEPGIWLVGGENGRLRVSRDAGRNWTDFGDGFPYLNIAALNVHDGRIFATVSNEDELSVFETTLDDGTWQQLSSNELEFSFWTGVPIFPQSFVVDSKLVTSLPTNGLLITDLDDRTSTVRTFPGSIFKFGVGGDGVLRCMCTKALFNNPWKSADLGDNWERSEHDRYMWVPHFTDVQTGYGLLKGRVLRTVDGGATWEDVGPAPKYATTLGHFEVSGDLYAVDEYAFYYRSSDGGKTWEKT